MTLEGVDIPGERTVYRVMEEIGLTHKPKRKPNGITKADKGARKSDDLIKRDFSAERPLEKCITDMTEIKASDGKLYVSAIFDCYDLAVLGLAMDTNMKAALCEQTLDNAYKAYPMLRVPFFTATEVHSILASCTVTQSINMAFFKVWTVPVADAMTMQDVKVCGHDSKKNYFMDATTPPWWL